MPGLVPDIHERFSVDGRVTPYSRGIGNRIS